MGTSLAPGLHVPQGRAVDSAAYDRWIGRWSRLFVPMVLAAAEVQAGRRVLDVSTGTGEAALAILPTIGASGLLVGADIAPAMLEGARGRLNEPAFLRSLQTGRPCRSRTAASMPSYANSACNSFPTPALA